jgi:hypothetical protein
MVAASQYDMRYRLLAFSAGAVGVRGARYSSVEDEVFKLYLLCSHLDEERALFLVQSVVQLEDPSRWFWRVSEGCSQGLKITS